MAKTAVALYDTVNEAQQVVNELTDVGFNAGSIQILSDNTNNVVATLTSAGLPRSDADAYAEGIRRGSNVVMITTEDDQIDTAVEIMDRFNSINIQERAEMWRNENGDRQHDLDEADSSRQAALTN